MKRTLISLSCCLLVGLASFAVEAEEGAAASKEDKDAARPVMKPTEAFDHLLREIPTTILDNTLEKMPELTREQLEEDVPEFKNIKTTIELSTGLFDGLPDYTMQYITPFLTECLESAGDFGVDVDYSGTKKQLPTRIAKKAQRYATEDLSPHMYVLLMPEAWGEPLPEDDPGRRTMDDVIAKWANQLFPECETPQESYVPDLTDDMVAPYLKDGDMMKRKEEERLKMRQRTKEPSPDSPLTEADALAFLDSLPAVRRVGQKYRSQILNLSDQSVLIFKDMTAPCQTMVQRLTFIGGKDDLANALKEYGFTPEGWGLTCDKTIRATRAGTVTPQKSIVLTQWQDEIAELRQKSLTPGSDEYLRLLQMEAMKEMYTAPTFDRRAVKKHIFSIRHALKRDSGLLLGVLIYDIDSIF